MESLTTPSPPGRGRPRKFDEDTVLDALTRLFWNKGFEATSMEDILEASGLRKSSLYNAFGSKTELFHRVLDRYVTTRMETFAEIAGAEESSDISALHSFLDSVFSFGRAGCLAVNTTTELGTRNPDITRLAQTYRDRIRAALHKVIVTATRQSDAGGLQTDVRTELLLGFLLGYAVAARTGADDAEMAKLTSAAHTLVESWD